VTALRLAHRGDARGGPENTVAAMHAALGGPACDGLEFDVRGSADGVAVILHDPRLGRVQGREAAASELTAAELAALGVPTLAEVLAAAGRMAFLDIEFKEVVPAALADIEDARGAGDAGPGSALHQAVVTSFHDDILRWLRDERPRWRRWLNADEAVTGALTARALELGCEAVSLGWRHLDAGAVAHLRAAGLEAATWTVVDAETYRRLEGLGVIAICAEGAALDG
jgi:glycerophosphoryl diester phosphodiesterase